MRLRNAKDLLAGFLFLAFGLGFLFLAHAYQLGSARRMGPAYFPVVLSLILIGIGLATIVRGCLTPGPRISAVAVKALALITVGIVLFGLLVQGGGFGLAVVALVGVSAVASRSFRPLPTLILALVLAAFCVLAFVNGLGLPFPALGPWLKG
jgi:putative tricarboxylic transport membrane protein